MKRLINHIQFFLIVLLLTSVSLGQEWTSQDIGNPVLAGSMLESAGIFMIEASGEDIFTTDDQFHFAYQTFNGDVEIIARVVRIENTHEFAKTGVMIRETLASGAKNTMMSITPATETRYQYRSASGGLTSYVIGSNATPPYWVKLARSGNQFTGSISPDGSNWTIAGTSYVPMTSQVFIGLAVTSHNTAQLCTAELDNVTITIANPTIGLLHEVWTGISGTSVEILTTHPNYPDNPDQTNILANFEGPVNLMNYYGSRIRGYVHPPVTGSYSFWIAGDDNSELWLSTDDTPANAVLIANVPSHCSSRQWTKFPEQASGPITLIGGLRYYVEVLHKEHTGEDHIAVGWQGPGITGDMERPIPGTRLTPWQAGEFYFIDGNRATPMRLSANGISDAATVPVSVVSDEVIWKKININSGWFRLRNKGNGKYLHVKTCGNEAQVGLTDYDTTGAADWKQTPYGGTIANFVHIDNRLCPTYSRIQDNGDAVLSHVRRANKSVQWTFKSTLIPYIISGPESQRIMEGQTATFSVTAAGALPLSYQWRKKGVAIEGATSSIYTTPPVTLADNNQKYDVVITNSLGSVTSDLASLNVIELPEPPVIITHPQSQTIIEGYTVTFTVEASGTLPFTYQWQKDGNDLIGATSGAYTINAVAMSDEGTYRVRVTNSAGQALSEPADLTVLEQYCDCPSAYEIAVNNGFVGTEEEWLASLKGEPGIPGPNIVDSNTAFEDGTIAFHHLSADAVNRLLDYVSHTFTDYRDGQAYKKIRIGAQTWMAQNLNYDAGAGSWCYADSLWNCSVYGRLYDWNTAMAGAASSGANPSGVQGVCPEGWHLPSDAEWTVFKSAMGGSLFAGLKLKAVSHRWDGTDAYGFTALPGGLRYPDGYFDHISNAAFFWTATEHAAGNAWHISLASGLDAMEMEAHEIGNGYSIRCIQD